MNSEPSLHIQNVNTGLHSKNNSHVCIDVDILYYNDIYIHKYEHRHHSKRTIPSPREVTTPAHPIHRASALSDLRTIPCLQHVTHMHHSKNHSEPPRGNSTGPPNTSDDLITIPCIQHGTYRHLFQEQWACVVLMLIYYNDIYIHKSGITRQAHVVTVPARWL